MSATRQVDEEAIGEYLTLGYTLNWKTFEKGKKYEPQNIKFPKLETRSNVALVDIKKELENYFMKFDGKKVAVFLSGGKDSRLIAEICKSLGLNITALTFGYGRDSRENVIAEKVSSVLGIPHVFWELTPEIYSEKNLNNCLKLYKSDPTASPRPEQYYYRDTLSKFDAVFTGDYMTYSLRQERFYQPKNVIERLLRTTTFDNIIKKKIREKIKNRLIQFNSNKTLNEICLQKFRNHHFKIYDNAKKLFGFECPAMEENILNTMWSISEKEIVKRILKKYYATTYHLSCTRSPLPLSFPWIFHYGYRYIKNTMTSTSIGLKGGLVSNADMGIWCGYEKVRANVFQRLANNLLEGLPDLDILDKKIIENKIKFVNQRRDYIPSIEKLMNFKLFNLINGG